MATKYGVSFFLCGHLHWKLESRYNKQACSNNGNNIYGVTNWHFSLGFSVKQATLAMLYNSYLIMFCNIFNLYFNLFLECENCVQKYPYLLHFDQLSTNLFV